MKFSDIAALFESQQLDEALGPLANLNAGDLINVFKQQKRDRVDNPQFVRGWNSGIGQGSEQLDLGEIKSWKDLRKKVGPTNERSIEGAIFYVDGQAFAAMKFPGANLRAPTSEVMFAFDPSKLPELPKEEPPEGLSGWQLDQWNRRQQERIPSGTARQSKDWQDRLRRETGVAVELRQLERYIDDVIAHFPNNKFTVVGITTDKPGFEKQQQRRTASARDDELQRRTGTDTWGQKNAALQKALDKYKASKNFNTFFDDNEVIEFLSDYNNIGEKFVYQDKEYEYRLKEKELVSVPVQALMKNTPFTFTITIPETAKGSYQTLRIHFRFENGQLVPFKLGY